MLSLINIATNTYRDEIHNLGWSDLILLGSISVKFISILNGFTSAYKLFVSVLMYLFYCVLQAQEYKTTD